MWKAVMHAYCGLRTTEGQWQGRAAARRGVARFLRYLRRRGYRVGTLEPGVRWEINEPLRAVLVDEEVGVLTLSPPKLRKRRT